MAITSSMKMVQDGGSSSTSVVIAKKGSSGSKVREIQTMLKTLGYDIGSAGADGIFGSKTEGAVKSYQNKKKMTVTGVVTSAVYAELKKDYDALNASSLKSSASSSSDGQSSSSGSSSGSVANFGNGDVLTFPEEYTIDEIQSKLNQVYNIAPTLIKERADKVKYIVNKSAEKIKSLYITEKKFATTNKNNTSTVTPAKKDTSTKKDTTTKKETTSTTQTSNQKVTTSSSASTANTGRWPINLKQGMSGSAVKELQIMLSLVGYYLGDSGTDGIFGAKTKAAVLLFQSRNGLKADGIVGPKTRVALESAVAKRHNEDRAKPNMSLY